MESIAFSAPLEARWKVAEEPATYGVVRPTVYLDTTIPSYLTNLPHRRRDIARCQRVTRVWWRRYRGHFELRISDRVRTEARGGNELFANRRLAVLHDIIELEIYPESERLAALFVDRGILPATARKDAEHIAISAIHSVQYLLTWNCKHLANPFIARQVVRTCEREGYRCPTICTPETLMRACTHAKSHVR